MECKFLTNGIAIKNDGVIRPCCAWETNQAWSETNHYTKISNLGNWHQNTMLTEIRSQLESGVWSKFCKKCEIAEKHNQTSMRENGNDAYKNYNNEDITLEIRPGNVCNFACSTCGPGASSRIASFMYRAKMANRGELKGSAIQNFDFLNSVSHRIRDVIVLGGEPFYDKHCKQFLKWAITNLKANIVIFTNGLYIDYEFLKEYSSKITLVFSLDAVDKPAEYMRFGTDWKIVQDNYLKCCSLKNVEVRVNITISIYNLLYIDDLLKYLNQSWPDLVTIGNATEHYLHPLAVPLSGRQTMIDSLLKIFKFISQLNIPTHQKQNIVKNIQSVIEKLSTKEFDAAGYEYLCKYIKQMDAVKQINMEQYCPELYNILFKENISHNLN